MTGRGRSDRIQTAQLLLMLLLLLLLLVLKLLRVLLMLGMLCELLLLVLLLLLRHEAGRRQRQRPGLVLLGVEKVRLAMRVELLVEAVQAVERVKIIRIHICGGRTRDGAQTQLGDALC
jgi:hypothetical protein